jgi:hypothetical protein
MIENTPSISVLLFADIVHGGKTKKMKHYHEHTNMSIHDFVSHGTHGVSRLDKGFVIHC